MASSIKYGLYINTPDGWEYAGARKTLAGAQSLADRKLKRRVTGWFARSNNGFGSVYSSLEHDARIERGWF